MLLNCAHHLYVLEKERAEMKKKKFLCFIKIRLPFKNAEIAIANANNEMYGKAQKFKQQQKNALWQK